MRWQSVRNLAGREHWKGEGFIEGTHLEWYLYLQPLYKQLSVCDCFTSEMESLPILQPRRKLWSINAFKYSDTG